MYVWHFIRWWDAPIIKIYIIIIGGLEYTWSLLHCYHMFYHLLLLFNLLTTAVFDPRHLSREGESFHVLHCSKHSLQLKQQQAKGWGCRGPEQMLHMCHCVCKVADVFIIKRQIVCQDRFSKFWLDNWIKRQRLHNNAKTAVKDFEVAETTTLGSDWMKETDF